MNTNLFLPGDEMIDMFLAEFLGYFWCRYLDGLVVGQKVVRFLLSSEQFYAARRQWGETGIVHATGDETVQQLAFGPVPAFHASRDEMAKVEHKLEENGLWTIYLAKLRELTSGTATKVPSGPLSSDELWRMTTAHPTSRARAAFLVVDAQKPKLG